MAEYLAKSEDLTAVADAIRAKGGTDAQLAFPDGFVSAVGAIQTGTTITDGIVVTARDAAGYPTDIDYYGDTIGKCGLGIARADGDSTWLQLKNISFKAQIKTVRRSGLKRFGWKSGGTLDLRLADACTIEQEAFDNAVGLTGIYADISADVRSAFRGCTSLKTATFPKLTTCKMDLADRDMMHGCTALETVQFGSIGHGVEISNELMLNGCTNSDLVATAYCAGEYVDTLLSNIRNGATNATIIIKAAADTTYNGTVYAAGDTILTSTPEASA